MKQNVAAILATCLPATSTLPKKIGLKAKRRIEFYTSTIDCRLLEYELYAGSRTVAKEPKAV